VSLEFWANVSTVWLALLCFVGMLIPLAAAFFAVRGMHVALLKSREGIGVAQRYSGMIRDRTDSFSRKIAKPVIRAECEVTKAGTVLRNLADDNNH
jgi:hypothetical protein